MKRVLPITAIICFVAAGALLGGVFSGAPSGRASAADEPRVAVEQLLADVAPGDTAGYVRSLERKVERHPADAESFVLLGLAYLQRARETADTSFYPKAEEALRRGLQNGGDRYVATTGLASLAASRHQFAKAGRLAKRARDLRPRSAAAYGVLADSLIERGRYTAGIRTVDRMASLRPSLSSYARISYARELLGRRAAALRAMKHAFEVGSHNPESMAWTLVQAGNLLFDMGRLGRAAAVYRAALARVPGYLEARGGLARIAAARGKWDSAVARFRRVVDAAPDPGHAAELGDVLLAAGRPTEARAAWSEAERLQRRLEDDGIPPEPEMTLFALDHGRDPVAALARARTMHAKAPSIESEDVLAWALYRNGRCEEARAHSERALRLGTRDALMLFHRGMIERCLGDREAAEGFLESALDANPHFSVVHAPKALALLR